MTTNDTFESELTTLLRAHADITIGPEAIERVMAADYRPRAHRLRAPVTVGALASTAGAATAATVVLLGGSVPAYAGWSATPTTSDTSPSSSAAASCQSQLSSAPLPNGPSGSPASSSSASGSWQPVATDVRGPFTVALYQDGGTYAVCFTSSSFTEINMVESNGSSGHGGQANMTSVRASASGSGSSAGPQSSMATVSNTASGDLSQVLQNHLSTTSDGPYTLVDGRTASDVTGVTLVRTDGQDVEATVTDGWLIAWWPGGAAANAVQVTTGSGTTTEALVPGPAGPAPVPPGATCSSSGSSSSGSSSGGGQAQSETTHCSTGGPSS